MSDSDDLPVIQRIAFGTGHILNIMTVVGMWYPYSVMFFQKVLLLSPSSTATILLVSQVFGAIFTPFIGTWSDFCVCSYGRRKIFHLIGIISVAISFFFIWFHCIGCEGVEDIYRVVYYSSFAIVFQFGWASTQISQLALIPELASNMPTKMELNSIRYGVQVVSAMVVFILMWILLATLEGGLVDQKHFVPHMKTTFWVLALIVVVVGFILSLPFQVFIREKSNVHLKKIKWYKWLENPSFYLVICTFIVSKLVTVIPLTYIPLYFLETLQMNKTSIAIGPLVLFIVSCVLTPFVKIIHKYVGIKMMYIIGIVIVWIAMVWFWFQPSAKDSTSTFNIGRDDIYIAIILFGVGGTIISVMALTFLSLLVGEYTGSGAFVYGWAFFADRFSNGIVNNIILRVYINDASTFYRYVIVYVSLAASVLGLVAVVMMKALELWQSRRDYSTCKETESQTASSENHCNYGAIQNDDGSDHVPLLKSSGSEPNAINVEDEQKHQQPQVENSQETPHDKTDTVTDIKEELCDLSMYRHDI